MKKIRPLAPHLVIYKSQLTSLFSIYHRISGSVLSLFLIFGCIFLYLNFFFQNYYWFYKLPINIIFLYTAVTSILHLVVFIIWFHVINGLRHISWDLGLLLKLRNLIVTSLLVFTLSIILTVTILI